ncbi:MAG: gamma carbonic anhydrase family protein [Clostridiales bacterium]|nr:gamma carbonic anhydrase family protein [Candidatus Cacconaster stercorequi]
MIEKRPVIDPSVFVAENATVLGNITIGADSSVLFGAVMRAEHTPMVIGRRTNVQDNCILHVEEGIPVIIGDGVTVGHGAILHGCTIGDNTLIGMGAIVLNGAKIGRDCLIGAGALVPQNAEIPDGSMVLGMPGRVRRPLTPEEIEANRESAAFYVREAQEYREYFSQSK